LVHTCAWFAAELGTPAHRVDLSAPAQA
jgi:hypothetical protein